MVINHLRPSWDDPPSRQAPKNDSGLRNLINCWERGSGVCSTRWAPTSYKWSYKPYKWPYNWVTGVITPISGVITILITGRGPTLQVYVGNFLE